MSDVPYDWPWATCLELSAIHTLWIPLLDLSVCRKNQAVHKGRLSTALGLGKGQIKSQRSQRSTFTCRLSVRLNHWKCLQLYSSATGFKLHRVGWEGFLWVGLMLPPPRFMLCGGECSAQERWLLHSGEWPSTGNLAADSSALSPEAPTPTLLTWL